MNLKYFPTYSMGEHVTENEVYENNWISWP